VVLDRQLYVSSARASTYHNGFFITTGLEKRDSILCTFRFSHRKWKKMLVPSDDVLEDDLIGNIAYWLAANHQGYLLINHQEALKLIEHYGRRL
jgi:hypothetical protein